MDYIALRDLHISCAVVSVSLFGLRGYWMLRDSNLRFRRWVKIVPHLVDTALLASAVSLAILSAQYPLAQNWLSAKVVALLLYIALGTVALKTGKTRRSRAVALLAAICVFAYIGAVAISKQVLPFT
jgi:uncharacterized membrane protein SirB2